MIQGTKITIEWKPEGRTFKIDNRRDPAEGIEDAYLVSLEAGSQKKLFVKVAHEEGETFAIHHTDTTVSGWGHPVQNFWVEGWYSNQGILNTSFEVQTDGNNKVNVMRSADKPDHICLANLDSNSFYMGGPNRLTPEQAILVGECLCQLGRALQDG